MKKSKKKRRAGRAASLSELRRDLVSGDWVVVATGRARRPYQFRQDERQAFIQSRATCPFEKVHTSALLLHSLDGKAAGAEWWVQVFPNKYPAFSRGAGRTAIQKIGCRY